MPLVVIVVTCKLLLWEIQSTSSTAVSSKPYQQQRLSASIPNRHHSSRQWSHLNITWMPLWTDLLSIQHGICPTAGEIQTSSINDSWFQSSLNLVRRGLRSGMDHEVSCKSWSWVQYMLYFWMAAINAGCHLAMAFHVCWWSFFPGQRWKDIVCEIETCYWASSELPQLLNPIYPTQKSFQWLACVYWSWGHKPITVFG